jgi:hypothetical protein
MSGITSESEEAELEEINNWTRERGLPIGIVSYDYADPSSGEQKAIFDLAWPDGLQPGLNVPVALLLNEGADVISIASGAGYRCFTAANDFRAYVEKEILNDGP